MVALWPVLVCCLAKWGGSLRSTQDLKTALAMHGPDMSSTWNQTTVRAENQLAAEQMAGNRHSKKSPGHSLECAHKPTGGCKTLLTYTKAIASAT